MIRQGNENSEVSVFRYVTESTFDAYSWQLLENKQRFISQIMTSKSPARMCDDLDEAALSYAEVKALAAGNPMIKEMMDLDIQVSRLKNLKAEYSSQHYRLEDAITIGFPREIQKLRVMIRNYAADVEIIKANTVLDAEQKQVFSITLNGIVYDKREDAGKALLGLVGAALNRESAVEVGSFMGFKLMVSYQSFEKQFHAQLVGEASHDTTLGADAAGNMTRLQNVIGNIPVSYGVFQNDLAELERQLENAKQELQQPFAQKQELQEKSQRLAALDALLNAGNDVPLIECDSTKAEPDDELCTQKQDEEPEL